MRLLFITLLALLFLGWQGPAANKLANTRWTGIVNAPQPVEGVFEFKTDSFVLYIEDKVVETAFYEVRGDTLIEKKLSGFSPCGEEIGTYTFKIKDNVLTFFTVHDDCTERTVAFSPEGYKKKFSHF